jgi:hypothetical protein
MMKTVEDDGNACDPSLSLREPGLAGKARELMGTMAYEISKKSARRIEAAS